jgi:hypothetical protein
MSIRAICPECGAGYQLPDVLGGKEVHCMHCAGRFIVDTTAGPPDPGIRAGWPAGAVPARRAVPDEDDLPSPAQLRHFRRNRMAAGSTGLGLPSVILILILFAFAALALPALWLFKASAPAPAQPQFPLTIADANVVDVAEIPLAPEFPLDRPVPANPPDTPPDPAPAPPERAPAPVPVEPKPVTQAEVAKALVDARLPRNVGTVVDVLARAEWDPKRAAEAAKVLAAVAKEMELNLFIRCEAARALGRWNTADSLITLHDLLNDPSVQIRHAAIDGLAALRLEQVCAGIAGRLAHDQDRGYASSALQALGPVAERAVVLELNNQAWEVRHEACKILAEIGTIKSLPRLQELVENDPHPQVRQAAARARGPAARR